MSALIAGRDEEVSAQQRLAEGDLRGQVVQLLLDHQRAVAGVEAQHPVVGRLGQRGQRVEIVVDLLDRAARVVLAGQYEQWRPYRRDIGQRRALGVKVGELLR